MASIYRLIFSFLILISSAAAYADSIPVTFVGWSAGHGNFSTPALACADYKTAFALNPAWNFSAQSTTYPYSCQRDTTPYVNLNYVATCPTGSVKSSFTPTGVCTFSTSCTAPLVRNQTTGVCGSPPCVSGDVTGSGYFDGGTNPATTSISPVACSSGCTTIFSGVYPSKRSYDGVNFHYYGLGQYTKDGTSCTAGASQTVGVSTVPVSPADAAIIANEAASAAYLAAQLEIRRLAGEAANQAKLDAAAAAGTAANNAQRAADNAQAVKDLAALTASQAAAAAALDAASADATNASTTATAEEKAAATAKAAASAATSSTAAVNAGASTAAATSAGTAAATAAGTAAAAVTNTTQPDPPKSLCETNPNIAACKIPSVDAGFCFNGNLTGFTCSGDAIQCSIAKASANAECFKEKTDATVTSLSTTGESVLAGTASLGGTDTFTTPTQISIGSLDTTATLSKGCLADQHFVINGIDINLPLSKLCEGLQTAGKIVLAFAYMIAARIIFS
jgi:hypothetical protein